MKRYLARRRYFHPLSLTIFILYLILLFWVLYLKGNWVSALYRNYYRLCDMTVKQRFMRCLIPFSQYFGNGWGFWATVWELKDFPLNIIAFIPLGVYLSYFFKKHKLIKVTATSFLCTLAIEGLQLFTILGAFCGDDLLGNTLGGVIGYLIYRKVYSYKRTVFLNTASIVVLVMELLLLGHAIAATVADPEVYFDILLRRI